MAWSVNRRLIVVQLTLALIIVYLYIISKVMQLDRLNLRHPESDHFPHPVRHARGIDDDGTEQVLPRSPAHPQVEIPRSESDVARCRDIRRPDTAALEAVWQRQDHPYGTIYVYSAIYDGRSVESDQGRATVRLLVLASGLENRATAIYCHIYAGVPQPVVVRAGLMEMDADIGRRKISGRVYVQYLISCLLEQSARNMEAVSVVVGDRCGSASTLVPVHYPAATTQTTQVGICGILAWPVSATQQLPQSAPWLIEWMELQITVFGASRVFLYGAFDDDLRSLKQLVRFYAARKSLVVRRIPHPVDGRTYRRREVIANLRALAANDCLLRGVGQFHYLINVDVDEVVVPRHVALNYSDMIVRIKNNVRNKRPAKLKSGLSSSPFIYFFHVVSFVLDASTIADEPNSSRLTTTGYFRSRGRPEKGVRRAMVDTTRCLIVSPSAGCDVTVTAGGVTSVGYEVPLSVAGCHRYRRHNACAPDVGCETAARNSAATIKDKTMLRFHTRLKYPVMQALRDSGTADKERLYQVALNA